MRGWAAVGLLALVGAFHAPSAMAAPKPGQPTPWDACFEQAGAYYKVNPLLLKAIARQESSMNPAATNKNTNGTEDVGLMQINSIHLPKLAPAGINRERLRDPCTNIAVGAWVLAEAVSRLGMTWDAVGAYHSPTAWRRRDYAAKVQRHLIREIQGAGIAMPVPAAAQLAQGAAP